MGFLRSLFAREKAEPATDRQRSYINDLFEKSGQRELIVSGKRTAETTILVPEGEKLTEVFDKLHPGLLTVTRASQLIDFLLEHNSQLEDKSEPATDRQRSYIDSLFEDSGDRELIVSGNQLPETTILVPEGQTLTEVLDRDHPHLITKKAASKLIDFLIKHNIELEDDGDPELRALEGVAAQSHRYSEIAKRLNTIDNELGLSDGDDIWYHVADRAFMLDNYEDPSEVPFELPITAALLRRILKGMDERQALELLEQLDEEIEML